MCTAMDWKHILSQLLFASLVSLTVGAKLDCCEVLAFAGTQDLLRVTTILIEPYVMQKKPVGMFSGNDRFEGYIVDMLDELSNMMQFKYELNLVKDNRYGFRRADGTWDGMIGELIKDAADMAAAPMFVTDPRKRAVDFTQPFLNVQATMLQRRPSIGQTPMIQSAQQLLGQSVMKYGTQNTGIIKRAFKTSNNSVYQKLWNKMEEANPSVLCDTNEEGIMRVRRENYIYILPNTIGDYITRRYACDLITVDNFLFKRGYALALQKDSPFLYALNYAIEKLHKDKYFDKLYEKWWSRRGECNHVNVEKVYSNNGQSIFTNILIISVLIILTNTVTLFQLR